MFLVMYVQLSIAVCRNKVEKHISKVFMSEWYVTSIMGVVVFQVPKARALEFLKFSSAPDAAA
jgi:hypothetical protein